jgi:hypothetical protein
MSTANIIAPSILKIFRDKQYLIILQGSRGSGKTFFASELKKIHPNIEICSIDDFFLETHTEYNKSSVSDAYYFCKQKTRKNLQAGKTVIYNNVNLDDTQLDDIVTEAKMKRICPIILRFLPVWNEEKCVKVAEVFHPNMQFQNYGKQTIIRDNINLIHFQNIQKLGCFGIRSYMIQDLGQDNSETSERIIFTQCPSNIDNLKQKYLEAGYFQEKQKTPKAPRLQGMQHPPTQSIQPLMHLPPSFSTMVTDNASLPPIFDAQMEIIAQRYTVESLQNQVEELQEQLAYLSCYMAQNPYQRIKQRSFKRERSETETVVCDE